MLATARPRAAGLDMDQPAAQLRAEAIAIFRAAVNAADPSELVQHYLSRQPRSEPLRVPVLVVGAGKCAAKMASGCEAVLGGGNVYGEVVVADGCSAVLSSIRVSAAGHPLPDGRGEDAARRIVELLRMHHRGDVLCLISGGASSLMVYPRPPVTLQDKIVTTRLLLQCGADIQAFNTVRKHLSVVKGGGLLRHVQTRVLSLLISDVIGDDPSNIGSGPTAPDHTTFADAWSVLRQFDLTGRVPVSVTELLQAGIAGRIPETVKPEGAEAARGRTVIIGSSRTALEGAAAAARTRGWTVHVDPSPLQGDTTEEARRFAAQVREIAARTDRARRLCVVAGGETTVKVVGNGRGGRNQEFALALAESVAGTSVTILSAGTDGIDGPTDAAGAFVDGTTTTRARTRGVDPSAALAANDSYHFFAALGDLFRCGPTSTNVMDIKIALVPPPATATTS